MNNAKVVATPLAEHFKLSSSQCPSSEIDKEKMKNVPYSSMIGSLMYAMICTKPDIAYVMGLVSRFLANQGKEY